MEIPINKYNINEFVYDKYCGRIRTGLLTNFILGAFRGICAIEVSH